MYKKLFIALLALVTAASSVVAQEAGAEKEDAKKLKISTRVQTRLMMGETKAGWADKQPYDSVDINFRRIRFGLEYDNGWYGSKVEVKAENLLSNGKSAIQEANLWYKPGIFDSKIVFGQYKIPFIREQMGSSGSLMLPERGFSSGGALGEAQQQDIGLMITFNPLVSVLKKKFQIGLSVTNGDGSGHDGVGRKVAENPAGSSNAPLWNWRVEFAPLGYLTSAGKEIFNKDMTLIIGAGGYHTGANEYASLNGGDFLPINGYSFDVTFSVSGLYVNGEYTMFTTDSVKNWFTYQATVGYNLMLNKTGIMPAIRYNYEQASTDGNSSISKGESWTDIWFGVNVFLDKHSTKLQAFYKLDQDTDGVNGHDQADNEFYFQVTTSFGSKFIED